MEVIGSLADALIEAMPELAEALVSAIKDAAEVLPDVLDAMLPLTEATLELMPDLVKMVSSLLPLLAPLLRIVLAPLTLMMQALNYVAPVLQFLLDIILVPITGLLDGLASAVGAGEKAFSQLSETVHTEVGAAMDFIKSIPQAVKDFFVGAKDWLVDAGKAIINGFKDGLKKAWEGISGWFEDKLGDIRELFPFSPAKKGPFSGKGWVLYSGLSIGQAFGEGLAQSLSEARASASDMLGAMRDDFAGAVLPAPTVDSASSAFATRLAAAAGEDIETIDGDVRVLKYYAAPNQSIDSFEELFKATRKPQFGWAV
jgi:phage-related protein